MPCGIDHDGRTGDGNREARYRRQPATVKW
jgi:hypothetical protein